MISYIKKIIDDFFYYKESVITNKGMRLLKNKTLANKCFDAVVNQSSEDFYNDTPIVIKNNNTTITITSSINS